MSDEPIFITSLDLSTEEKLAECTKLSPPLLSHIPNLLISLGSDGVVYARKCGGDLEFLHYPAATSQLLPAKVVNVTGAGDRLVPFPFHSLISPHSKLVSGPIPCIV